MQSTGPRVLSHVAILGRHPSLIGFAQLRPWQAAAACIALALDPAFSYAFRTQSYITLLPCAWVLLSVHWLLRSDAASERRTTQRLLWSGASAGIAIFGYFIHAFFVPALMLALGWITRRDEPRLRWRRRSTWIAGLAAGASSYAIGYALILRKVDGWTGLWAFIDGQLASLGAFHSNLGLPERVAFVWRMVVAVVSDAWHHSMMFGEWIEVPGTLAKLVLLVGVPLLLWLVAEVRRNASAAQRLLVALPMSFALMSLIFGNRLGGHHFVALLPIFYGALALGVWRLQTALPASGTLAPAGCLLPFLILAAVNSSGQLAESQRLVATRGVGLMSDAVTHLADDLNASARKPWLFFPDWGLALPIAFLTRGTVGMTDAGDPEAGHRKLCEGRDLAIALINGDRTMRRDDWTRRLAWDAPDVKSYRQGNGTIAFEVVTYRGDPAGPGCGDMGDHAP
jgi:hypothetical protein